MAASSDPKVGNGHIDPPPLPAEVEGLDEDFKLSEDVKVTSYQVVRNTADYYTYSVVLRIVQEKDCTKVPVSLRPAPPALLTARPRPAVQMAWEAKPEDVVISVEDRLLRFVIKGHEFGACLKLPKRADPSQGLDIDLPPRGGCFVTVSKVGSKQKAPPLDDQLTGRGPRVIMKEGKVVQGNFEEMCAR